MTADRTASAVAAIDAAIEWAPGEPGDDAMRWAPDLPETDGDLTLGEMIERLSPSAQEMVLANLEDRESVTARELRMRWLMGAPPMSPRLSIISAGSEA